MGQCAPNCSFEPGLGSIRWMFSSTTEQIVVSCGLLSAAGLALPPPASAPGFSEALGASFSIPARSVLFHMAWVSGLPQSSDVFGNPQREQCAGRVSAFQPGRQQHSVLSPSQENRPQGRWKLLWSRHSHKPGWIEGRRPAMPLAQAVCAPSTH